MIGPQGMSENEELPSQRSLSDGLDATLPGHAVGDGDRASSDPSDPDAASDPSDPDEPLRRGAHVGRYTVLERIGAGGMGVVYAAFDPQLDRRIALKVMHPGSNAAFDSGGRTRLLREAQAMAKLSHPNVITVHDVGTYGDRVFVAMEFIEGSTLRDWSMSEWNWPDVVDAFVRAGRGLASAHAAGLVHRDFKPDNVLMGNDGRVLVMDFGLARQAAARTGPVLEQLRDLETPGPIPETKDLTLTRTGAMLGTPAYMAPEQARGELVDARCDQFSFCVTLHECLYGVLPFEGSSRRARARNARRGRIRPPPARTSVPRRIRRIVLRGLRPDPESRWPDMNALLSALSAAAESKRLGLWFAATAATAAVSMAVLAPREDPCEQTRAELDGIWNAQARRDMRSAFESTGLPRAAKIWARTEHSVEGYASQWEDARSDACRDPARDDATRTAQRRCLHELRAQLEVLADVFTTADEGVVQRAAETVADLRPVSECTNPSTLIDGAQRLPPGLAEPVSKVRARLSSLAVLRDAQRYERALRVGQGAVQEAESLGFDALRAEALFEHGQTYASQGELAEAAQRFEQAYYVAESCGHDRVAADVATNLFFVYGYRLGKPREAERWRGQAEAAVERVGTRLPNLKAELIRTEGTVALRRADYPEARGHFEAAMALHDELGLTETLRYAEVVSNLGVAHLNLGELDAASQHLEHSRAITERLVGSAHPRVATIVNNLGNLEQTRGRHELAYQHFLQAYEIDAAVFGREHIQVAMGLNNVGTALLILERAEEATEYFETSIRVYESGDHHGLDLARPVGNLAVVYSRAEDHDRAIELLRRAIDIVEAEEGPLHAELSGHWLNLGSVYLDQDRHDEALAAMERALQVDRAALGADHPYVAQTLASMAAVHLDLEHLDRARPLLETALEIQTSKQVDPVYLAATRFDLARALWPDASQRATATRLLTEAEHGLVEAGVPGKKRLSALRTWRDEHPTK